MVCLLFVDFFVTNKKFLEPGLQHIVNGTDIVMSTLGFVVSFLTKSSNQTAVCAGKKKERDHISLALTLTDLALELEVSQCMSPVKKSWE